MLLGWNNMIHAQEIVQLPVCLAKHLTVSHPLYAYNDDFHIIGLSRAELEDLQRLADEVQCGRFINLSEKLAGKETAEAAKYLLKSASVKADLQTKPSATHYAVKNETLVQNAVDQVIPENIWKTLTHLTHYPNRAAMTVTGVEAAHWLKSRFETMAQEAQRTDTEAYFVGTGTYAQPSLVTVVGKKINAPAIVIGAHMDTLSGVMPGAGDDGSGSASVMEMARVVLASQETLKRPIYFIWYAAEEQGLVGSQHVVQHFKQNNIPVAAAIQFDMAGYRAKADDPTMWIYTDYTDHSLNGFVEKLIKKYVQVPVAYSQCGYGCSDHASWDQEGIPASFPCESDFKEHNPYIHTSSDVMSVLSLEHMTNFAKLGVAFALELGLQ